jgi:hypothetical protein
MIISINAEKVFDKIQYLLDIKALKKLGTGGSNINTIKATFVINLYQHYTEY